FRVLLKGRRLPDRSWLWDSVADGWCVCALPPLGEPGKPGGLVMKRSVRPLLSWGLLLPCTLQAGCGSLSLAEPVSPSSPAPKVATLTGLVPCEESSGLQQVVFRPAAEVQPAAPVPQPSGSASAE